MSLYSGSMTLKSYNPFTGKIIAEIPETGLNTLEDILII